MNFHSQIYIYYTCLTYEADSIYLANITLITGFLPYYCVLNPYTISFIKAKSICSKMIYFVYSLSFFNLINSRYRQRAITISTCYAITCSNKFVNIKSNANFESYLSNYWTGLYIIIIQLRLITVQVLLVVD